MTDFKIGDYVRSSAPDSTKGLCGVVIIKNPKSAHESWLVEFPAFKGHRGNNFIPDRPKSNNWYVRPMFLTLVAHRAEPLPRFPSKGAVEEYNTLSSLHQTE